MLSACPRTPHIASRYLAQRRASPVSAGHPQRRPWRRPLHRIACGVAAGRSRRPAGSHAAPADEAVRVVDYGARRSIPPRCRIFWGLCGAVSSTTLRRAARSSLRAKRRTRSSSAPSFWARRHCTWPRQSQPVAWKGLRPLSRVRDRLLRRWARLLASSGSALRRARGGGLPRAGTAACGRTQRQTWVSWGAGTDTCAVAPQRRLRCTQRLRVARGSVTGWGVGGRARRVVGTPKPRRSPRPRCVWAGGLRLKRWTARVLWPCTQRLRRSC